MLSCRAHLFTKFFPGDRIGKLAYRRDRVAPVFHSRWLRRTHSYGTCETSRQGEVIMITIAMHVTGGRTCIAAFTSERTNLSPFTKGCRERDASMRLFSIFGIELRAQSAGQRNKARRICI